MISEPAAASTTLLRRLLASDRPPLLIQDRRLKLKLRFRVPIEGPTREMLPKELAVRRRGGGAARGSPAGRSCEVESRRSDVSKGKAVDDGVSFGEAMD